MMYVNKEKILEEERQAIAYAKMSRKDYSNAFKNHADEWSTEWCYIEELLDNNTEDAAPVIHAKWIHHTGMNSQCSNCGSFFPVTEFKQRPFKVNHCINCGARMDLEPEELKPVIKAKWETGFTFPDGEYWKCTSCKEIIKVRAGAMNFCGHCGAQMEREK